jgi:hypothetical protein
MLLSLGMLNEWLLVQPGAKVSAVTKFWQVF